MQERYDTHASRDGELMKTGSSRLLILFIGAVAVLCIAPFLGMEFIAPSELVSNQFQQNIFWSLRVPRVLTGFIAGAGLSLCGMVFQALFRNPLADPFTLGVASGASCGAAFMILSGVTGVFLGIPLVSAGAFMGSVIAIVLVFGLSTLRKNSTPLTMLLAGVAVSFLFSSLLMFLQYISSLRDSFQIVRWLMGGIEVFGYDALISMTPMVIITALVIGTKLPELDQLLSGEDIARSRGVNVAVTKYTLLLITTFQIGSIVSICGPIGFVGLMIPHICRILFSSRHKILGPAAFLMGGTFLVMCDTVARVVIAPAEMPVGILTALLGGPFFLWLLFGKREMVF